MGAGRGQGWEERGAVGTGRPGAREKQPPVPRPPGRVSESRPSRPQRFPRRLSRSWPLGPAAPASRRDGESASEVVSDVWPPEPQAPQVTPHSNRVSCGRDGTG